MRGLLGLCVAGLVDAGPFQTVIKALEDAAEDAKAAQQVNDDEFTKIQCKAQELIDDSNEVIPIEKKNIEKYTATLEELRSDNQAKSIEISELQASVAKNKKELAEKTQKRNDEAAKYATDKSDMETGMAAMDQAIKLLTEGTANFLQVRDRAFKKVKSTNPAVLSLLQTGVTMKTSGQIIGVLNSMKDTFVENLADMTAAENLAIKYFTSYKERTEAQIKAETKLYEEKQAAVQANSQEIATTVTALETSQTTLAEKEEQLRVQTEHLAAHTKFHQELKAESLALLESIQNAIELLGSPEALKTMAKSEEHMTAVPSFLQIPKRTALLAKQQKKKGANAYSGWGTIYDAIDDMTAALTAELSEADEKFANCEQEISSHLANERDLKTKYNEDMALKASTETAIDTAKDTIKTSQDTIATSQKTIQDTMDNLNKLIQDTDREIAEGKAATKLFNEAIAMLSTNTGKEMGSGPQDDDDTTAEAAYDSSKIKEGTSRVTAIIEKVRDDMNKEINDMVKDNEKTMQDYRDLVQTNKDTIEAAEGDLGKAQQSLADSKTVLAGTMQRLKYTEEGLAAELKWWGDENSGTNLDTRGQECIKYMGREELVGHDDRNVAPDSGYKPTDKITGDGLYHSTTAAKNAEKDGLAELKTLIEGLEQQYLVPQF